MFKRLSVILSLFLTACTNNIFTTSGSHTPSEKPSSGVDRTYFVGNWACEMDGGKIGTSNKVKLSQDGHAAYLGNITMPKQDPLFQFQVERIGSWSFADNILAYQFTKSNVTRAHTYEMLRKIKTSKELNATENEYFDTITSQMTKANQKPLSLKVSEITPQAFMITQTLESTVRTGHCKRVL